MPLVAQDCCHGVTGGPDGAAGTSRRLTLDTLLVAVPGLLSWWRTLGYGVGGKGRVGRTYRGWGAIVLVRAAVLDATKRGFIASDDNIRGRRSVRPRLSLTRRTSYRRNHPQARAGKPH